MKVLINERQEQLINLHNSGKPILEEFLSGGKTIINEVVASQIGCDAYNIKSLERKFCSKLNNSEYRPILYPFITKLLESKKKKWINTIGQPELVETFLILNKLRDLDPDKKWQYPCNLNASKICYGTISDFIDGPLRELSFVYDEDKWLQINKLDTNYSDSAVLITDIIRDSKTLDMEKIYQDLTNGDKSSLEDAVKIASNYPDIIYNRYLVKSDKYSQKSVHNSKEGADVEKIIVKLMQDNNYKLIYPLIGNVGGGGDPIDILLGIDLIMLSPEGELVTIQCKKVWSIIEEESTMLNPDEGAFKINGKPYISKQRNLDYVGYGTLDGKGIVAERQRDVIRQGNDYVYDPNKKSLPTPLGNSPVFYIDKGAVIAENIF
jgi:hypothetical protein